MLNAYYIFVPFYTRKSIEKDINYDRDGLCDFPHFLIRLHNLLDPPLKPNRHDIPDAIELNTKTNQIFAFSGLFSRDFALTAGNLALYLRFFDGMVVFCSL